MENTHIMPTRWFAMMDSAVETPWSWPGRSGGKPSHTHLGHVFENPGHHDDDRDFPYPVFPS